MSALAEALAAIPEDLRAVLRSSHFDEARLVAMAQRIGAGGPEGNRVRGRVEPPAPGDVLDVDGAHADAGRAMIARGEVAFCVLAGGMATRMGGVVKALVEVLPGMTFLDYRLREAELTGTGALWLMTSWATNAALTAAIGDRPATCFGQDVSLRLTKEGELFLDEHGRPSPYAPGHGDLPDALVRSGLLDAFLARGGKVVWIANIDNLGANVDPAVLGAHLAHGAPVSVEVVDKVGADKGGIPARLDGRPQILEEFRLPTSFDASTVRTFNTNTFLVDARALRDLSMAWTYFEVRKKVSGAEVVQFERLLGELTASLSTRFLRVPREGATTRFLPVKDGAELEARRKEIDLVAHARGVL